MQESVSGERWLSAVLITPICQKKWPNDFVADNKGFIVITMISQNN